MRETDQWKFEGKQDTNEIIKLRVMNQTRIGTSAMYLSSFPQIGTILEVFQNVSFP